MKIEKPKKVQNQNQNPFELINTPIAPILDNSWLIEDLPSNYRLYAPGTQIYARPFKTLDVKLLSSLNQINYNEIINQVLSRTVSGINVEDLLIADKLYLIFWIRANTYKDSGYKVEYSCGNCESNNVSEIMLSDFNIKYINENYTESYELTLKESGHVLTFHQPRVREELITEIHIKNNPRMNYNQDILNTASTISTINSERQSLSSIYDFLIGLEAPDYAYIESYIKHCDFGLDPIVKTQCAHCKEDNRVAVTFREDFFIPTYTFD